MARFRRQRLSFMLVILALLAGMACPAATHYVVPPGTAGANPTDPYTNWATAGTNLIEVVNAALTNSASRLVWVTNGTYYLTNQIYLNAAITIRSVNGRDLTILDGADASTNRCAYYEWSSASGSVLDGFTVTNYNARGQAGTIYANCIATIINCSFLNNTNTYFAIGGSGSGGGIHVGGSGVTITNCIFKNNWVSSYGGAIYGNNMKIYGCHIEGNFVQNYYGAGISISADRNNVISNCVIINNSALTGGAGITALGATNNILNCIITGNVTRAAASGGAGIYAEKQTTIRNCSIIGNITPNQGGGILGGIYVTTITIQNCLIARNQSTTNTGGGVWMTNGTIESCTVVSNYAAVSGGGVYIDGPSSSGTNNIIYFNTAASAANFTNTAGNTGLKYSCVIPAVNGAGNITNNPVLKDPAGGDYRLRMTSPCVNTGTNQPWMTNAVDLQGNARILKTIVDMGAYETRLWQGTIYSAR